MATWLPSKKGEETLQGRATRPNSLAIHGSRSATVAIVMRCNVFEPAKPGRPSLADTETTKNAVEDIFGVDRAEDLAEFIECRA